MITSYKMMNLLKIQVVLTQISAKFAIAVASDELEDLVIADSLDGNEIMEDIANGVIKLPKLVDSITQSYADESMMVYGYKFCEFDEYLNEYGHYFLIATMDGFFFFVDRKIAFVEYDALRSVRQDSNGVVVSASKVNWYSEDGSDESGDDEIVIERNRETKRYLGILSEGLEKIIEDS